MPNPPSNLEASAEPSLSPVADPSPALASDDPLQASAPQPSSVTAHIGIAALDDFAKIPSPGKPNPASPIDGQLLVQGALEGRDLTSRFSPRWRETYDWAMRFVLRPVLFVVIVGLNIWWDVNVRDMLWLAGYGHTGFHLDNAILIALITTSMANFLALVAIIAKHLFPDSKD